jgi:hypothetical protein
LGGLKSVLLFDLYGLSSNHKIREDARLVRNTIREGVKSFLKNPETPEK